MLPLISYIVAIYNTERYLRRCIESLLAQTYGNVEILLINDGSTDGSKRICEEFANKNPKIKLFNKPNGGLSDARNYGLNCAKGEYIIFVDSDDWCEPTQIQAMTEKLLLAESDIYVYGYYNDFASEKTIKEFSMDRYMERDRCKIYKGAEIRDAILLLDSLSIFNTVWNKMYRKAFLLENHIFFDIDGMPGEDLLFNANCFRLGTEVCVCNSLLYHYMFQDEVTLSRKYMPDLYERNMRFCRARNDLYEYFDMKSAEERNSLARHYVQYCFGCIPNSFRSNAPKDYHTRTAIFRKLFQNEEFKQYLQLVKKESKRYRLLSFICGSESVLLAYMVYGSMMFFRNKANRAYKLLRKTFYIKNGNYR